MKTAASKAAPLPQGGRPNGLLLKRRRSASNLKALPLDLHGSQLNILGLLIEARPSAPLAGVTDDNHPRGLLVTCAFAAAG